MMSIGYESRTCHISDMEKEASMTSYNDYCHQLSVRTRHSIVSHQCGCQPTDRAEETDHLLRGLDQ